MDECHEVFLGLGSNLGDRRQILTQACGEIERLIGPIVGQSAFYESQPWGFRSEHAFLNAVVCCSTRLAPRRVLRTTQLIERGLGRKSKSENGVYHDRTIDIDILLYDNWQVCEADLRIPHPLMLKRDFVLRPLTEVFFLLENHKNTPPIWSCPCRRPAERSAKKSCSSTTEMR